MMVRKMNMSYGISTAQKFVYHYFKFFHGLRVSFAFVIVFIVLRHFSDESYNYVLITLVSILIPAPYWGTILMRSFQRIIGIVAGSALGILLLYIEILSYPLMLIIAIAIIYFSCIIALGKNMYIGMLAAMSVSIVVTAPSGDMMEGVFRSLQTIGGALLALIFSIIYCPKGFIFWRLKMSAVLHDIAHFYERYTLFKPEENIDAWKNKLANVFSTLFLCGNYVAAANKETGIPAIYFQKLQNRCYRLVSILQLLSDTFDEKYYSQSLRATNPYLLKLQRNNHGIILLLSEILILGRSDQSKYDIINKLRENNIKLNTKLNFSNQSNDGNIMMLGIAIDIMKIIDDMFDLIQMNNDLYTHSK